MKIWDTILREARPSLLVKMTTTTKFDWPAGEEKHGASQCPEPLTGSCLRVTCEQMNVPHSVVLPSLLNLFYLRYTSSQVRDVAKGMAAIAPVRMLLS